MDIIKHLLWRFGTDTQVQGKFTAILGSCRTKKPKRGQKYNFRRKTSIPIVREIGTTLLTSTMGYRSPNFSMYQTIGDKVRTQVGKTRERIKHGYHRQKEEPIHRSSR